MSDVVNCGKCKHWLIHWHPDGKNKRLGSCLNDDALDKIRAYACEELLFHESFGCIFGKEYVKESL